MSDDWKERLAENAALHVSESEAKRSQEEFAANEAKLRQEQEEAIRLEIYPEVIKHMRQDAAEAAIILGESGITPVEIKPRVTRKMEVPTKQKIYGRRVYKTVSEYDDSLGYRKAWMIKSYGRHYEGGWDGGKDGNPSLGSRFDDWIGIGIDGKLYSFSFPEKVEGWDPYGWSCNGELGDEVLLPLWKIEPSYELSLLEKPAIVGWREDLMGIVPKPEQIPPTT